MTDTPARQPLDEDIAQAIRRVDQMPTRVVIRGLIGVAFLLAMDFLYDHDLSIVAWIAVVGVVTITIPVVDVARVQRTVWRAWANDMQASRHAPPPPPPQHRTAAPAHLRITPEARDPSHDQDQEGVR